jgi:hypothetical protein
MLVLNFQCKAIYKCYHGLQAIISCSSLKNETHQKYTIHFVLVTIYFCTVSFEVADTETTHY